MKARKESKLTDLMTLKLEGDKTVLYIKDKPFRQCMRLLLNIPREKIQYYENIESIDDLSEIYKNTDYTDTDITPEEEFIGHYSNLQTWIENGYDTCLLHSNLAFPLLKELAEHGSVEAKKRFKEEVIMRFLSGNFNVTTYLIKQRYLSEFTEEELDTLFEEYDFSNILTWKLEDRYQWLQELVQMKIRQVKPFFKQHVISLIKEENWYNFSYILNNRYRSIRLDMFSVEELEEIFNEFNFESFLKYAYDGNLKRLLAITILGIRPAKELLKEEIKKVFSKGSAEDVTEVLSSNYLKMFSKEEVDILLKSIKLKTILATKKPFRILSILQDIAKYNKELVKKHMRNQIEWLFSKGSKNAIKDIINRHYLDNFTDREQESIVRKINFENLRKPSRETYLSLLRLFSSIIPSKYKEEVQRYLLHGDSKIIEFMLEGNYFRIFNKEELSHIFEEFDFNKFRFKLDLLNKLTKLGVPLVRQRLYEIRSKSDKLVNLKNEIIEKFETGDYYSLHQIFYKYGYQNRYKDKRLNDLISEDFEEIFESIKKSETFTQNFELSLHKDDLPFSIPFKVLVSNIDTTKNTAKDIFKEQASKIFVSGRPLNIIAFLSRPEYSQFFTEEELKKVFTFRNEQLKSTVMNALEKDSAAALPLVILKRLTDNGDKDAEEYLQKNLLQLIDTADISIIRFLNKDDIISCLKGLSMEMQLYLVLSPDLNYLKVWKDLKPPKVEELVDENVREDFKRIITNLQKKDKHYLGEEDANILKETLLRFGADCLRGLIALYSRESFRLQFLATECILKIYRNHKSKVRADIKQSLKTFFNSTFKAYYKYEYTEKLAGIEEYKELLENFKTEYNEIKNK